MPAHMLFARHVVVQCSCVHAMQDPLTSCTAATLWVCRQKARRGMRWCFDHVHANVMLFMCCVSAGAPSRGACFPKIVALRLRKSLETSGRALTQKRKMQGHLGKKGSVFCPLVVCAGLARATFWGRFPSPLFSCVLSRGAQMWPLTVGFGVEDAHPFCRRRVAHCTNALSQPPRPRRPT